MEAIIYLVQRNIVNSLKELKKKPLKLILYVVMGLLIVVSLALSVNGNTQLPDTNAEMYRAIFLGLILMFLFISLKTGIEKGNTLFRLSDVNFLFTAPIKSQLILFYGFARQMGSNFIFIFLLVFQMPNLYNHFPMKNYGWLVILWGTFLFTMLASIMGVLAYSIGSVRESYKKLVNYALYGLVVLVLLGLIAKLIQTGQPLEGTIEFLNMGFFKYIPVIGWLLNMYSAALLGFNVTTVVYFGLIALSGIGFLFIIYNLDLDYYEDALNNSVVKEAQLAQAKTGKVAWARSGSKTRRTTGGIHYTKGKAILSKQILEAKKTGLIAGDRSTLFIAGFSLLFAFFVREGGINALLYMMIYMNILFSQSNQWSLELDKHYIYLIPENSIKKIIYATLLENMKALLVGLITFTIATFIFKISLLEGIILGITYASFTSVILFSDLIIRRILGAGLSVVAERLLRFLMLAFILVPGLILSFIVGLAINAYTAGQGAYLVLILYNALISLLLISISKGIFEKIDMR